jgi:hypothetical protein
MKVLHDTPSRRRVRAPWGSIRFRLAAPLLATVGLLAVGLPVPNASATGSDLNATIPLASGDVPYVPLFNLDEFIALGSKFTFPPNESSDNWDWVVDQWPFHIKAVG